MTEVIRTATEGDIPALKRVAAGYGIEANLERCVNNSQIEFKVLESQRKIIGFVILKNNQICNWNIHPDEWNKGFGTKLFNHSENAILKAGYNSICLSVESDNTKAINFYEKYGYIKEDLPEGKMRYYKKMRHENGKGK